MPITISPRVVFQAEAQAGMQRGIDQLVAAIRPTLGPHGRMVMIERTIRTDAPSLLDDGATIARRVIQLPGRDADTGAMLLRHMLWRIHEDVGDGTATAAVMLQSLFSGGAQHVAAGLDPMRMRRALERAGDQVCAMIEAAAQPLHGKRQITQAAESICHDPALAAMLGEVFDIIGAEGQLAIQSSRRLGLEREYTEGMHWPSVLLSPSVLDELPRHTWQHEHVGIIISDLALDSPADAAAALERALEAGNKALMLIVAKISEQALRVVLANQHVLPTIVIRTPGAHGHEQMAALEDLAVATGARPLLSVAGQRIGEIHAADIGHARRAWTHKQNFGIAGGNDAGALRKQIARLRDRMRDADVDKSHGLRERIGRLQGGTATLLIGGATESEITARRAVAERIVRALRRTLAEGVVPGGGTMLLECAASLRAQSRVTSCIEERAALSLLARALEMPFEAIVSNAGGDPSTARASIGRANAGCGIDVRNGATTNLADAGVWDSAGVLRTVVRAAVQTAALALTVGVIIHPAQRVTVTEP